MGLPRTTASAFSIQNHTRELQRQASRLRIEKIRWNNRNIIKTDVKTIEIDNPFVGLSEQQLKATKSVLSLSAYNRPEMLARPRTAQVNIYQGIAGLEPP